MATERAPDKEPSSVTTDPTPSKAPTPTVSTGSPAMQAVAKHGTNIPAISAELLSAGVVPSSQLAEELQRLLGNSGAMEVMSALSSKKPEPKPETEKPIEKPPVAQSSEVTSSEPTAKPQDKTAPVPVPSAIAVSPGQTRPAYEVTYLAVKKAFEKLGFSVEGKGAKVIDLSAPKMTDTGFDFKTTTFSKTDSPEGERTTSFSFGDGLQKQVSQSALANSTEIAMNPIAEPTTLIHETVHRFQVGEIGTYLYEPMTELIAALAFEELAQSGAVTGAYTFAPDYLPWVLFTKDVLAPKLGWKRLVGYYVGQGITDKDQLAVELGFAPNSPPHKQIMEALTSGQNLSDRIPALTKLIKEGPSKPAEKPKGHHKPGAAIDGEDKTAPLDGVVDQLEKRIAVDAKSGETLAQTAQRLKSENKTSVIQKMIAKAEEFLIEAKASHPGLVGEIESTIEMLRSA